MKAITRFSSGASDLGTALGEVLSVPRHDTDLPYIVVVNAASASLVLFVESAIGRIALSVSVGKFSTVVRERFPTQPRSRVSTG